MAEADQVDCPELMALSLPPSKKVCAFSGMKSFGAHYRVDMEQGGPQHVTFDSGVAELQCRRLGGSMHADPARVELVRVGILKNILVLSYGNMNIVLMAVSRVPKHTEERPTMRHDSHGFWLANTAARPRDTTNPYLLPALASQVGDILCLSCYLTSVVCLHPHTTTSALPNHGPNICQVFFVEDRAMPGWSVVLNKEIRSRRINSTEEEHGLGQEDCMDDMQVFPGLEFAGGGGDVFAEDAGALRNSGSRRRNRDEAC